jgi:glycosyltransferase involved in cell wall biosynthesis
MELKGFVFGFVGRLVPEKGLTWMIAAMDQIVGADADTTLIVIGDGPERVVLEDAARSRSWLSVRGPVEPDDLPAAMRAMDVLLLPSLTTDAVAEQFGKVVVEAMMCGIPVIASTAGSLPEVTAGAAVLVPELDTVGLAEAMRRMRDEPLHRQQLVDRAKARAATFHPSAQAPEIRTFWQRCRDAQARAASLESPGGAD